MRTRMNGKVSVKKKGTVTRQAKVTLKITIVKTIKMRRLLASVEKSCL